MGRRPGVKYSAVKSDCGTYRYALSRSWGDEKGRVVWVMLNPSTADEAQDDPTIRRCIDFTRAWGFDAMTVVNLFAYRATDPSHLPMVTSEAVGPLNDLHVDVATNGADMVIAAWGASHYATVRAVSVLERITRHTAVHCLVKTKTGCPKHPLYVPRATRPVVFASVPSVPLVVNGSGPVGRGGGPAVDSPAVRPNDGVDRPA